MWVLPCPTCPDVNQTADADLCRHQIYKTVLGNYCDMFDVSAGILLNPNMHSRFDRFEFSIYYKVRSTGLENQRHFTELSRLTNTG